MNEYMWRLMLGAGIVDTWSIINAIQNEALDHRNKIEIIHDKCSMLGVNEVANT